MKYSDNNKPLACIMTNNPCYKGTSVMEVVGVLWHSTGANNPSLKRYVQPSDNAADEASWLKLIGVNKNGNDWNHIKTEIGVNAFIGKLADGTVTTVQTLPWHYRPWGCAGGKNGSCNSGWIQFEICEDNLKDKAYFEKVYKEACELTAYLCKKYSLDPYGMVYVNGVNVPVILCHADSYRLGMGSNHGDVYHWFNKYGKTMEDVRNDVAKLLDVTEQKSTGAMLYRVRKSWDDTKSQIGAYSDLNNAKKACKDGYTVYDENGEAVFTTQSETNESTYKVKVTANALNIRAGAGTNYKITGCIRDKGVYTIVETSETWGKLKSGAGWISLNYTERV